MSGSPLGEDFVDFLGKSTSLFPGDPRHKNTIEESNGRLKGCRQSINRRQELASAETS